METVSITLNTNCDWTTSPYFAEKSFNLIKVKWYGTVFHRDLTAMLVSLNDSSVLTLALYNADISATDLSCMYRIPAFKVLTVNTDGLDCKDLRTIIDSTIRYEVKQFFNTYVG